MHQGVTTIGWLRRLLRAFPNGNAMGVDASSLLAKLLRDTDALLQKGQVEGQ
jgi:hypothetical protein